ncbi:type II toxin-antitoxin system HipA family toxin YjjJ [Pseudoduganella sp. FT25W]|uniref:Type II toxin-antitoxin system HipA family toxin YjjJ n=1 Tax=Duganella alba TaxID=2666081 RepID=A0A6L5Q9K0_9BURK|nr:type II toxin-antitoxin system HipA family toxin YjjJ [Duganella alba]MRX06367.1 type II toxin-antitoxin system HipA family toxin YjjJ [Duganella alba]MRX14761.1 type II toxin-antitoxin system HipA family toxin YjjJ [Duganella alba]
MADILHILRLARVLSGADLLARLQKDRPTLSRATMMRMVRELGDQVVVRGAARRTSYAARRPLRGSTAPIPVYRIDRTGRGEQIALLDPIYPAGCALRYEQQFEWPLAPEMRDGWFPGLPYPLDDMRPQGFLGRNFARNYASLLQVGADPQKWPEDDILYVLSNLGADSAGNYIIGDAAYRRHLETMQQGHALLIEQSYPQLAASAMQAGDAGSSAGGEFPKFTAFREHGGERAHVIVKFSGNDHTPGVQRWSDLLVCEHLALEAVGGELGLAAARSRVHRADNRTFLEVERFDRHGEFGRSAVCSWAALDAALFGMAGENWSRVAARMLAGRYINAATHAGINRLWHFGRLIANSDMHEGNLAFVPGEEGQPPLALAPAYDMLPMLYAPARGVELPLREFAPALPLPPEREDWLAAADAAIAFWRAAGADERISAAFRATCKANGRELKRLRALAA